MRKKELTKQQHAEMISEMNSIKSPKDARAFHKKYKKYGHGLYWHDRYPKFHLWCMGVSVILSITAVVISSIALLLI